MKAFRYGIDALPVVRTLALVGLFAAGLGLLGDGHLHLGLGRFLLPRHGLEHRRSRFWPRPC